MLKLSSFLVFLVLSNVLFAQSSGEAYKYHTEKTHSFNLGIGFPNVAKSALDLGGFGDEIFETVSPQFTFKYEYAATKDFGFGVGLGYYTAKSAEVSPGAALVIETGAEVASSVDFTDLAGSIDDISDILSGGVDLDAASSDEKSQYRLNAYTIAGRFAYHKQLIENFDTYTATTVGFAINKINKVKGPESDSEDFDFSAPTFVYTVVGGGRYFFNENLAAYGEFGWGSITLLNLGVTYRL